MFVQRKYERDNDTQAYLQRKNERDNATQAYLQRRCVRTHGHTVSELRVCLGNGSMVTITVFMVTFHFLWNRSPALPSCKELRSKNNRLTFVLMGNISQICPPNVCPVWRVFMILWAHISVYQYQYILWLNVERAVYTVSTINIQNSRYSVELSMLWGALNFSTDGRSFGYELFYILVCNKLRNNSFK